MQYRIPLSTPHLTGNEASYVLEAFNTNWVSYLGPHVPAFEDKLASRVGVAHGLAVSSGTAALHLALRAAGVGPGDEVLVSTLTFCASVNPILYLGAQPVFVDSDHTSWNMDPARLEEAVADGLRRGKRPAAVVVVHLYGQVATMAPIVELCRRAEIPLIEDAAEALGADYRGVSAGAFGDAAIFSFNGNKVITTAGGGMLITQHSDWAEHARKLATQAREPGPHYEHREMGYNYRLSNVLAGIGLAQLEVLEERIAARRRNFDIYSEVLSEVPGITLMPEAPDRTHTRWLTTLTVRPSECGLSREDLRLFLHERGVEARPVWKPMHRQPVYAHCRAYGGSTSDDLFADGLCLPSGSNLSRDEVQEVAELVNEAVKNAGA